VYEGVFVFVKSGSEISGSLTYIRLSTIWAC